MYMFIRDKDLAVRYFCSTEGLHQKKKKHHFPVC